MKNRINIHFFQIDGEYFSCSDVHYVHGHCIKRELVKALTMEEWDNHLELPDEKRQLEIKKILDVNK